MGVVNPIILASQVFHPRNINVIPVLPIFLKAKTIATQLWYEYRAYYGNTGYGVSSPGVQN